MPSHAFFFSYYQVFEPTSGATVTVGRFLVALAAQAVGNGALFSAFLETGLSTWPAQIATTVLLTFANFAIYRLSVSPATFKERESTLLPRRGVFCTMHFSSPFGDLGSHIVELAFGIGKEQSATCIVAAYCGRRAQVGDIHPVDV